MPLLDVAWFVAGLALLVIGAEVLVRGASVLARRAGVSSLLIGLTVVALGTSAPELFVGVVAAWEGHTDVALGNVVGSNILNIFVALGATAVIAPFFVQRTTLRQDLPLLAGAGVAVFALASDGALVRWEGALLLMALVAYLAHLWRRERTPHPTAPLLGPADASRSVRPVVVARGALAVVLGAVALVAGARFLVSGGVGIAASLGMPDRVVALTLVAVGTSAPEIVTSLVAAARGQVDLAVGNVVGSNMLNLLLVLGASAVVRVIPVSASSLRVDLLIMVLASFLMLMLLLTSSRRRVGRRAGVVLLAAYALYVLGLLGGLGPVA